MNDTDDRYIPVSEVVKKIPGGNKNKVCRWMRNGYPVGGSRVFLQARRFGRRIYTKWEWVEQFFLAMNEGDQVSPQARLQHPNRNKCSTVEVPGAKNENAVANRLKELGVIK